MNESSHLMFLVKFETACCLWIVMLGTSTSNPLSFVKLTDSTSQM